MIVPSMAAIAVLVQSFGIAGQFSCGCSSPESCAVTGEAQCECSQKNLAEKPCCCSHQNVSETLTESTTCCHSEAGGCHTLNEHKCHCSCSDGHRVPAIPADNTLPSVNWELLLARLTESGLTDRPQVTQHAVATPPGVSCTSLHCSMQTLYCTWLT